MNRLHQLKETLLKNIRDNESYHNIEFIILDYNSQDGMEEWAKEYLMPHIAAGKVVYYKTTAPQKWSPSHSKNLAFKLATGKIICNIWADYFTGNDFADFVNESYQRDSNIVMTPIDFHKTKAGYHPPGDVLGKVCVKRTDFLKVHGFDERMDRHGFEDYDFINRLEFINVRRVLIEDFAYLAFLPHDDIERYTLTVEDFEDLYVCYINPSKSDCILLFKNGSFQRGTLIDNHSVNSEDYKNSFSRKKALYEFSLNGDWQSGGWTRNEETIEFHYRMNDLKEVLLWDAKSSTYTSRSGQRFYKLKADNIIGGLLKFKHFYYTRANMEENLLHKRAIVNSNGFGNGTVFKNFTSNPIVV
jgi:hypothetical protein